MKQLKLESQNTIKSIYSLLDNNALNWAIDYDLTTNLLKLKDNITPKVDKQKLQWEIEVSAFSFYGNEVFSFSNSNSPHTREVYQYPCLDKFQVQAFDYIKLRAENSKSPYLKAKYYHILWKGVTERNNFFAKKATENYIELIYDLSNLDLDKYYFLGRIYENLLGLVNEVKISIQQIKKLSTNMLFENKNIPFHIKHEILEEMLRYPKLFKPKDFTNTIQLFNFYLNQHNEKIDNFLLINNYLPTVIKIAQKTNNDVKKWHDKIGVLNLKLAEQETNDERNWIKLSIYKSAIDSFRLSGNQKKKSEAEQLYFQLKPKVKLQTHQIDFDDETIIKLKELNKELKEQALSLLKNPPDYIYLKISDGTFFPKYANVLKSSKNKTPNFLKSITSFHFDNNKNISKKENKDEEKDELLNEYGERIEGTLLPFLHYVFVLGIKSGHLNYKNMLTYFVKNTWIGKPHIKTNLGGELEETNWINQIAPSIVEFHTQVLAWGESKYYQPNFILCIDSLTLKVEGLFRNFSERLNISTSKGKNKGVQEVLMHEILDNKIIREYFNEDDRLLFDYVFSSEGHINLRNNIAHCFYSENEYHPNKMLLLLAVIFRLGKYNIQTKKS